MESSIEFKIILFVSLVLLFGAVIRLFSQKKEFSFSILIMIFGIISGLVYLNTGAEKGILGIFKISADGSVISSDLIIFVLLPTLIFEAAFGLDAHIFRRNLPIISFLSGPAIIINAFLVGMLLIWMVPASWNWNWIICFVFGALISATDPVAVTAIMRELGLSQNLITIIEGESLINDGTSIVLFSVLLGIFLLGIEHFQVLPSIYLFFKIVLGGILIGIVLAYIISSWIEKIFNVPEVEISLTIILGYLCMLISEGFFHVSGVMAVVVAGLWMSYEGKTKISPEISNFLHHFWQILAYLANTLIFFLVGIFISEEIQRITFIDLLITLATYLALILFRFIIIFTFRKLYNLYSNTPFPYGHAFLTSWSGLRGAVSLALVLVVYQNNKIDIVIRSKLLLLTVGIVFLTILVNSSLIKYILKYLKMDERSVHEKLSVLLIEKNVLTNVLQKINVYISYPYFKNIRWNKINNHIKSKINTLQISIKYLNRLQEKNSNDEKIKSLWYKILNIEKEIYWKSFSHGIIESKTYQIILHEINLHFDILELNNFDAPWSRVPKINLYFQKLIPKFDFLNFIPFLKSKIESIKFNNISRIYNLYRAVEISANGVLEKLSEFESADKNFLDYIKSTYNYYIQNAQESIEDIRVAAPEVTEAIDNRLTQRVALNHERNEYQKLIHQGVIEKSFAEHIIKKIELKMKTLKFSAHKLPAFELKDFINENPVFQSLSDENLEKITQISNIIFLSKGEVLFKAGQKSSEFYVVIRGAIRLVKKDAQGQKTVVILGGGNIIGEISFLNMTTYNATATSRTPVTLLKVDRKTFDDIEKTDPNLSKNFWLNFAYNSLENHIHHDSFFEHLPLEITTKWIHRGELQEYQAGEINPPENIGFAFIVWGEVTIDNNNYAHNNLIKININIQVKSEKNTKILWLPHFE